MDKKEQKKAKDKVSRFYFWIFIALGVLSIFLFWSVRDIGEGATHTNATSLIGAIIASLLSIFFGLLCFRRFLRKKSVAGGLFLTMSISTACFMLTSRFLRVLLPPAIMAIGQEPGAAVAGEGVVLMLAQIGLFALWFSIILYTVYIHVKPVRRIERYLDRISSGEKIKHVNIGKSQQYRQIEEKLQQISADVHKFRNCKPEAATVVKFAEEPAPATPVQEVIKDAKLSP